MTMAFKSYKYAALDEGRHQIRLLTLLPAEFPSPIRIELNRQRLPPGSHQEETTESARNELGNLKLVDDTPQDEFARAELIPVL